MKVGKLVYEVSGTVVTIHNMPTACHGEWKTLHMQPNDTLDMTHYRGCDDNKVFVKKYPTYTWDGKKFTNEEVY